MEQITKALLEYGILGVALIALGYAVYTLWKENKELQEARLKDYKETADTLLQNSKDTIVAVQSVTESVEVLTAELTKRDN